VIQSLDPVSFRDLVRRALEEDLGGYVDVGGDITTVATVEAATRARGVFLAKSPCVVAGLAVAFEAFRLLEPDVRSVEWRRDGEAAGLGDILGEVVGRARTLLAAERTALNFLQRLCGVATRARAFVDAAGGHIVVLDTRKTTPTLRALEKYAVRAGGATNHRAGLFDAVLIKDNHIRLADGIGTAVARARTARPDLPIEVEAQTIDQVDQALAAGVEAILLDNLPPEVAREAVRRIQGRARVEISGGVTLDRMKDIAATGADFVSVGALTHSAPAVDISFEIEAL
jgi:nicotinate-nucleotide pyrophosphorylase (carboxylating)